MDPKACAYSLEAVKVSMRQNKDGVMITLVIHPNDVPKDLLADPVGSRYQVAMVRLEDDNTPAMPRQKSEHERLLAQIHALCREPEFQRYMGQLLGFLRLPETEEECKGLVKSHVGVTSLASIQEGDAAKLRSLVASYNQSHSR